MNLHRRSLLRTGILLAAPLSAVPSRACEFYSGTFRVLHPWTRATGPAEDSAILCMVIDEVVEPDRLVLVETPLATGAEMGGLGARPTVDFPVPVGRDSVLSEHGTHVRLTGLTQPLEVGRSYPLTLGFQKAGLVLTTLNVDYLRFR